MDALVHAGCVCQDTCIDSSNQCHSLRPKHDNLSFFRTSPLQLHWFLLTNVGSVSRHPGGNPWSDIIWGIVPIFEIYISCSDKIRYTRFRRCNNENLWSKKPDVAIMIQSVYETLPEIVIIHLSMVHLSCPHCMFSKDKYTTHISFLDYLLLR